MLSPLDDIRSKIQRAEKHLNDFCVAIDEFRCANPYEFVRQPDLKSGQTVYDVLRADPVPKRICAIAGDAIQDLRTTLDYLACALVPGCRQNLSGHIYFPILKEAPTPDQLKTAFDGKVKGASQYAIDKIAELKPYKGGDDILWRLHVLKIIDKHRLLVAAQGHVSIFHFGGPIRFEADGFPDVAQTLADTLVPVKGGFPLKKGSQLFVDSSLLEPDQDVKFLVGIAVNEPNVCEGRPLITILRESFKRVFRIIGDFLPLIVTSKC